jgi:hypothetical protein
MLLGWFVGCDEGPNGLNVGELDGEPVGCPDGWSEGWLDGCAVGVPLG